MTNLRKCKTCGVEYAENAENFYYDNHNQIFGAHCKSCVKQKRRNAWEKKRDVENKKRREIRLKDSSVLEYEREYRKKNKSLYKECSLRYYSKNREKINAKSKEYHSKNRDSMLKAQREYYVRNKDKLVSTRTRYFVDNREHYLSVFNAYRNRNKDRINTRKREYHYKKSSDPAYRLRHAFSGRMNAALTGTAYKKGGKSWVKIVGYDVNDLKTHLESLFEPGMTWENYGEWHVDHIIPVSAFEYDSYEHPNFKRCWALTNLQPLWSKDNLSKGAKCDQEYIDAAMIRVTHALLKRLS